MSDDSRLRDTSDGMAHSVVYRGVSEQLRARTNEGLHDIDLSREGQDGGLLRAEVHHRDTILGSTDMPAQAVHGANRRESLHHGQGKIPERHSAAGDTPNGVRKGDPRVRRLL